jgi:hypothetical protein
VVCSIAVCLPVVCSILSASEFRTDWLPLTCGALLQVGPGDVVSVSGIFLPVPYTGFRAMRAGLVADTFLEATSIRQMKKRYQE